ncbi:sugar ABC transporter substrate-binding protein [Agrobacterium rosae]|uniref:Extracellular solute-binding protein n=2 Tax=Agrobacterium rosae TaxID=1972867 RepID=A0AAE5S053_9HYPH|nr:extracellular solute-binding protein [Agrobacterium rosae]KAA3509466.1 extracellular solute-binding protein [Agrobacterium rosae]KAA3516365.1 extracellular solute-binding protein [Agrobacterium rosae]MCM2434866.1 extracellular solute-binding protein [Agrobacterium rosae]MDX8315069.1 extracellular solute-binding protein [Agrobacterium rosae]MDX8330915.1 extracellular solute-binding protein [Agrobacterium rosae]
MMQVLRRSFLAAASVVALMGASPASAATELTLQRFFGACDADFGTNTDVTKAVGECGIITSIINKFNADNPDIHISVTTVEWPGYDQLTAQFAAGDPPDIVSIHHSAISDYQSKGLLLPLDELLSKNGITPDLFTDAARGGVTKEGKIYGLPIDNWTMLFHINMDLFKMAGLVNADGTPELPTSVEELLAQAKQFREKTGKPYMIQNLANEKALFARNFYTYLFQQDSDFFADPTKVKLQTPEAKKVLELYKALYDNNDTTKDMDYAGAINAFLAGEGGVQLNGTWVIGDYNASSETKGTALNKGGYAVYPYPQLFSGKKAQYADGHAWGISQKDRSEEQTAAIGKFLKFFADNDFEWARTGHLPSVKAVLDSAAFKALPHRDTVSAIATLGTPLPPTVQRQFAIQDIVGEEMNAAIIGQKDVDAALADMESRINDLLANL